MALLAYITFGYAAWIFIIPIKALCILKVYVFTIAMYGVEARLKVALVLYL
jgi:hypothetical protein